MWRGGGGGGVNAFVFGKTSLFSLNTRIFTALYLLYG